MGKDKKISAENPKHVLDKAIQSFPLIYNCISQYCISLWNMQILLNWIWGTVKTWQCTCKEKLSPIL